MRQKTNVKIKVVLNVSKKGLIQRLSPSILSYMGLLSPFPFLSESSYFLMNFAKKYMRTQAKGTRINDSHPDYIADEAEAPIAPIAREPGLYLAKPDVVS